jgi:hypothetical protein
MATCSGGLLPDRACCVAEEAVYWSFSANQADHLLAMCFIPQQLSGRCMLHRKKVAIFPPGMAWFKP